MQNKWETLKMNFQMERFLGFIHDPESDIQVFIKGAVNSAHHHFVGYFNTIHFEKLAKDVEPFSGNASAIYYGLNPVTEGCIDRANNCLKPVSQALSVKTADIQHRRLMLIDIDPVRESDCSATDEEKEKAYWLGRVVSRDLREAGWPKPVVVDSGNGYHLLYRVDLPVDDKDLVRNCLRALASEYDCEQVKIDTGVFDARRIAKLPGTIACKGEATKDRPHRRSGYFKLPSEFEAVPHKLLHELANKQATEKPAPVRITNESEPIANAQKYLATMPSAVSGQYGRNQFLNAACRLVDDFALSREQALPLLEEYNKRCIPPFDARGLADKLNSALDKVAERGGPSGSALQTRQVSQIQQNPKRPTKFIGFVPDFGLADKSTVLVSVKTTFLKGFGVWYWRLWQHLRSDTLVPDVVLRQWYWGAEYEKNWKARLKTKVKLNNTPKAKCTADTCLLFGSGIKHDHYHFFWLPKHHPLNAFCSPEERQPGHLRIFDVYGEQYKELREKLQKSGTLFNVYWPALVLGSSRKVGWSWPQQRLVVGMVLELTRGKRTNGSDIVGEIIKDSRVTASKNTSHKTICPLLDTEKEYEAFAGNGKRKGRGYQLVGRTGKGWIHRAGYLNAPQMISDERFSALKSFLEDLEKLREDLDLIPAAVNQGEWKNLDEMIDCITSGRGRDWLETCTMRIYAPVDWRHRWRQFFSEKLRFAWIPASPDDSEIHAEPVRPCDSEQITSSNQVRRWLKENKWTQQHLADEISNITGKACSLKRVQRHLNDGSDSGLFFEEVELVRLKHQKGTVKVTKQV